MCLKSWLKIVTITTIRGETPHLFFSWKHREQHEFTIFMSKEFIKLLNVMSSSVGVPVLGLGDLG